MIRLAPPALCLSLLLAGCATETPGYPSLAPRAVEKKGFAEPETKPVVARADPALDAKIAALTVRLDAIAKGFATDAARAESLGRAADGKPAGSDAWLDAQTALAALDDWRAQTSSLATDAEEAAVARAATLAPEYPTLSALAARITTAGKAQSATIARLQARLAPA